MNSLVDPKKPLIIVMGKNYSTPLGIIRSLGKAGYSTDIFYIGNRPADVEILKSSKYCHQLVQVAKEDDQAVYETLIKEYRDESQHYVLFPTDDYSVSWIDRFRHLLNSCFLTPYTENEPITDLMNKSVQNKIAKKCGFLTPKEWIVSLEDDPIQIPEEIVYPCFMKPLNSSKGGKVGIRKCENKEELAYWLKKMRDRDQRRSFIIQEYLDIIKEYTIDGVSNGQDIYIPAAIRKTTIAQYNKGVTLQGRLVDNSEIQPFQDSLYKVISHMSYVGMFDVEVLQTKQGFYFGEMNFRCGGPSFAYMHAGINLPEMAVNTIVGAKQERIDFAPVNYRDTFINNKVVWEDYANCFISKKRLRQLFKESSYTLIQDTDDPEPEHVFNKRMKKTYAKKRKKKEIKTVLQKIHLISE